MNETRDINKQQETGGIFKAIMNWVVEKIIHLGKKILKIFIGITKLFLFTLLFLLSFPVFIIDILIKGIEVIIRKEVVSKIPVNNKYIQSYIKFYNKKFKKTLVIVVFIFSVAIEMIKLVITGIGNIFIWIYNLNFLSFITKPIYQYVLKYVFYFIKTFIIKPLSFVLNLIIPKVYKRYYKENKNDIYDAAHAYIYLTPALILILIFLIYPLYNTFIMSFKVKLNYLTGEYLGLGLNYYIDIFKVHPRYVERYGSVLKAIWNHKQGFWRPFINTFIIVFVSVPISVLISLLIAVFLNSIKKLQGFFQTIFFLPYVTNVIAIGMVFSMLFNQDHGLINVITQQSINWIGPGAEDFHIMFALMVYTIWSALPFKIMVFLAGIQGIDKQYYQAAKVDAANRFRVFRKITVPLLSPFILYITITSCIGAFKAYASVIAMFGNNAGPTGNYGAAGTFVWYIYNYLNNYGEPGNIARASAGSVILFLVILTFTYLQMKVSSKRVHY